MGRVGKFIGRKVGGHVGRFAGNKLGKYTGVHGDKGEKVGKTIGGLLGELAPFKKGGKVKKTGPIYAHKGEFVLPKGVKPTKKQLRKMKK